MMDVQAQYALWCEKTTADPDLALELQAMRADAAQKEDAFYRELTFGTGGLRGVLGAGTNRMNVYTVARASQGLSAYVRRRFSPAQRRIAVCFDSRQKSECFAQTASAVFAENGIQVYIYPQLMPVPCLSFAVRSLQCAVGVMITASHNPMQYNGYKVYGADGCQITDAAAAEILAEIGHLDFFEGMPSMSFAEGLTAGRILYVPAAVYADYISSVLRQSAVRARDAIDRDVAIVYTPLNGAGLKPVARVLEAAGFTNVSVVPEQALPDGRFPTCPYPNPELADALSLGLQYARERKTDLLIATDPDCDRVGAAVRNGEEYTLLSGNEVGVLLLDYLCAQRMKNAAMPKQPVLIKTIVTTDMAEKIAAHYGVRTVNVLTGFKYIGEQIGLLEAQGKQDSFLFGFEESCGYLSGTYVRDKDGVNGAFLVCEMAASYKAQGITLLDRLHALYTEYGYYLNTLHSYDFPGPNGAANMQRIMQAFRSGVTDIGGRTVIRTIDYAQGLDGLPKSDVIRFCLDGGSSVTVRPSGTEPKLKIYLSVCAKDRETALKHERRLCADIDKMLGSD